MLAKFDIPMGWRELGKETWQQLQDDNGLGLAAQLAYYFFLAVFPALLFLIALASFFPLTNLTSTLVDTLARVAPPDVVEIIRQQIENLSEGGHGGILTVGVAAALWSGSAGMAAIIAALNRAYDVEEARAWWKQRLTAILLTVGLALFVLVSFTLVVAGPEIAAGFARWVGLGPVFEWSWKVLQWPLVIVLIATAVGMVYHFAPNVDREWTWLTPGSLIATALWLAASLAFRFYVTNFASYNATYGAIGGIMVLMLWFYISGLVLVVGAEMNAIVEHASPRGKRAGQKTAAEERERPPADERYHAEPQRRRA